MEAKNAPRNLFQKSVSANTIIAITLLTCYLLYAAGNILAQRHLLIDDSFITYRYAKNLANGYGIVWNPGEAPVEGYTNFLLVIVLAPFIKLGADPLFVTRVLSLLAISAAYLLLYQTLRKHYQTQREIAIMIISSFLLLTNTDFISMIGLETLIYTAALFLSFILAVAYLNTQSAKYGYFFGLSCFVTFLLRPEILLLVLAFILMAGVIAYQKEQRIASFFEWLNPIIISFFIPFFLYMLGKYLYFGTVIPNPYYIKAASQIFYSERGVASIVDFVAKYHLFCALALFALIFNRNAKFQREQQLAGLFCLFYLLFYMRVDTLMDVAGRFLYPMAIFLLYLSIPILDRVFTQLSQQTMPLQAKIPLTVLGIILLVNPASIGQTISNYQQISSRSVSPETLAQREYQVAVQLSKYERIKKVRIAFGDAGVIPYFTEALILDDVGLNDRFIATETDLTRLTNYYFGQKPDLAIVTSNKDLTWTKNGHGHLGDFSRWATNANWDEYIYSGTVKTENGYDLQFFLRKNMTDFNNFHQYLQQKVVDGYYDTFPMQIGNYNPDKTARFNWVSSQNTNK